MKTVSSPMFILAVPAAAMLALLPACDKKPDSPTTSASSAGTHSAGDGHDHKDGDDHHHNEGHGHGAKTDLGTQLAGGMTIAAARQGTVTPGGEASFDITVTGGPGKPAAVRVWIGAQDGKGSVKGKAEAEGNGWHAHAEVPNPLPAESKLWIEVETAAGQKHVAGFDLKS